MNGIVGKRCAWTPPGYRSGRSILAALVLACLVSGCQTMPLDERGEEPAPEAETSEPPVASIGDAIAELQEGRVERGRTLLAQLLTDDPDHATARFLMRQIEHPPESILGRSFVEVEVEPGDSLALLADRHAGNPLLFHALARLNDIERPRLLRPGQRLRVPAPAETPRVEEPTELAEAPAAARERAENASARSMEGERDWASLLAAARSNRLGPGGSAELADAAVEKAAAARERGDLDGALALLDQADPWLSEAERSEAFRRERARIEAELAVVRARDSIAEQAYEEAYVLLVSHGAFGGPDSGEFPGTLPAELVENLRDRYHEQALSSWRDQRVDEAVGLWERVVRIDPRFEPARIYLERARRVQRKLEDLSQG